MFLLNINQKKGLNSQEFVEGVERVDIELTNVDQSKLCRAIHYYQETR